MRLDRELACRDIVELVTAYLEHALSPRDRERFEEHLVFCEGCGTYLDQMRATIAATGRLEPAALPPELEARLLEAFRGWRTA
jgi:anti-sigma factor RsiW